MSKYKAEWATEADDKELEKLARLDRKLERAKQKVEPVKKERDAYFLTLKARCIKRLHRKRDKGDG